MKLTSYTDYAFRVLIYLGTMEKDRATIQEISKSFNISSHHLVKIVYSLNKHSLVRTIRGRSGGLELACDPSEQFLGDLVLKLESNVNLTECFHSADNRCPLVRACLFSSALRPAFQAFIDSLNQHSLADLIAPKRELRNIIFCNNPNTRVAAVELS